VPARRRIVCCCGARARLVWERRATVALSLALCLLAQSGRSSQEAVAAGLGCPRQGAAREIHAEALKACLERGGGVDVHEKTVPEKLDLRTIRAIEGPFTCHKCRFEGGIDGSDIVFKKTVDLTGSQIFASLRMRATRFEGAALFSLFPEEATTIFHKGVDFSLAVFGDIASFDHAKLMRPAKFTSTRFLSNASFSLATFNRAASFEGAIFADEADFASVALSKAIPNPVKVEGFPCASKGFNSGAFEGSVTFERASFRSTADFRQRCFGRSAVFARTDFAKRAEFPQAVFLGEAKYEGASMESGGTFRAADFNRKATFDQMVAGGSIDFTDAHFLSSASFFGLTSDDELAFDDATFTNQVEMDGLSVASIVLEVDSVKRVIGDIEKRHVLQMIESTAKGRGDLSRANDAYFERRKLMSERYGTFRRLEDIFIFRGLAGYLVRPTHPLISLAALALFAALIRWSLVFRSEGSVSERSGSRNVVGVKSLRGLAVLLWRHFRRFVSEYWRTVRRTVRDERESDPEPQPLVVEVAIYRVLFVVALIGLANSNPTLRQMIDAAL
jgi:Pentapeptide repeats (9 copies)